MLFLCTFKESHDSSVGIALGYGLDDRGSRVRFSAGAGNFCLHHCVQNGSGAHPVSYSVDTRCSFLGGKAAGGVKLTTHLHLVLRSKNEWCYTSTPQYAFMAWCSVKHRGIFTLLLLYFTCTFKIPRPFKSEDWIKERYGTNRAYGNCPGGDHFVVA
jgi:hypothetical protein